MSKRQRFVATSLLLSFGFVFVVYSNFEQSFVPIILLTLATLLLFVWSLKDGLGKDATLLTLIQPMMFTLGVGLFWFLLPTTIWARLPILFLYGFGLYALCLTSNIFTVSAVRTIALVRSAKSVGFVLTLFTSFLLFDAVISVKNGPVLPFLFVFLISFLLYLPNLWVTKLDSVIEKGMVTHSIALALLTASIYLFLFFWPVTVVIGSIFLTVSIYVILGLAQSYWDGHLFAATVREYLIVGIIVFIAMIVATNWRG